MLIFQTLFLGILLLVIPTLVGAIFAGVDKNVKKIPFQWITGQLLLWAGFQFFCVPLVLKERSFREMTIVFTVYMAVLLSFAVIVLIKRKKKLRLQTPEPSKNSKLYYILWAIFWAVLMFQLIQAVEMTYGDGDDAFYVAVSTSTVDSDTMYRKIPYTGKTTELDVRHGLAPFPIWIAYLAKITGVRAVSVAHIAVPLALIPMTYAIYYLLATKLFPRKKEAVPLFLILTELLVLFGDYSFYTVENFMLARSRQGKAALGSIIIPALILLLLILMEKLQAKHKVPIGYWMLLTAAMTAGCLCSSLGALLVCMLIGITGLCAAGCYRRWGILVPMALCCLPSVIYGGLYVVLG